MQAISSEARYLDVRENVTEGKGSSVAPYH
jgi:hypothetical protein